uniref:Uncharacterized protein n=1 Tax=Ditylenchus dipsaci TaxID=166011 RepID=A0A915DMN4_9BILA
MRCISCSSGFLQRIRRKQWDLKDPKQVEMYKLYRPERVTPNKRGVDLLKTPGLNKGMAFTLYERQYLGLHGLLPPAFMTEEQQAYRVIQKLRQQPDDLARYIQLDGLHEPVERASAGRLFCHSNEFKRFREPINKEPNVDISGKKYYKKSEIL